MPKHNSSNLDQSKDSRILANQVETVFVPKPEYESKKMVSMIDANIPVTGIYSGREYVFNRAGAVQDVDSRDVEWMLEKRQGERQCCGGTERGNRVFALWENK